MKAIFLIGILAGLICGKILGADYFPIKVGNYWVMDNLDSNGKIIGIDSFIIESHRALNNLDLFFMTDYDAANGESGSSPSELYTQGNDIFMFFEDSSLLGTSKIKMWQHDYKDEDSWGSEPFSFQVEFIGKVQVPKGIFDSCYFVKHSGGSGWVFAPNVGIIKTISEGQEKFLLRRYFVNTPIQIDPKKLLHSFTDKLKAHPNPFNQSTTIHFSFRTSSNPTLSIFNPQGHLINTLHSGSKSLGKYSATWDGKDNQGRNAPSGTYLVRLKAGDKTVIRKIALVR